MLCDPAVKEGVRVCGYAQTRNDSYQWPSNSMLDLTRVVL